MFSRQHLDVVLLHLALNCQASINHTIHLTEKMEESIHNLKVRTQDLFIIICILSLRCEPQEVRDWKLPQQFAELKSRLDA